MAKTVSKKMKTYRYLTNLSSGLVGRRMTVSDVVGNELGYTSMGNQIHVAYEHPIFNTLRDMFCSIKGNTLEMAETRNDMVRIGVTVHECLHQIFTNFSYERGEMERLKSEGYFVSDYDQYMYHQLMNLIEDPAIESMASQVVGGMPLKALKMAIRGIDSASDYSDDAIDEIHDLTKALIQFGDIGIVKNKWTFPKAKEVFLKIAPMFYDAINEPNGRKRIDAVRPILEEVRVLYREGAKPNKNADGSDEQLSRSSSPAGSGSGKTGKSTSKESEINRKRKITIKKVKRDEWEKMKKEAEENGEAEDDGKSDLTVIIPEDAKAEEGKNGKGTSIPMSEKSEEKKTEGEGSSDSTSGTSKEKGEEKEESDDESSSSDNSTDNSKDADHRTSNKGETSESNSSKSNSDKSPSEKKERSSKNKEGKDSENTSGETPDDGLSLDMSNPGHAESEEEANPFELTDEELEEIEDEEGELSPEETSKLEGMINSLLESTLPDPTEDDREEVEQREEYDTHAEVVAKDLHTSATCVNHIVHPASISEPLYEKLIAPYEADIELLRKDFEEIFRNDSARDYYARSGSVSLKRMTSKVASTRLFERTERSSEKSSIAIYMMVDMSGSTSGRKIQQERLAAILTAEALAGFNIPLFITGFTDTSKVELYHFVRGDNTEEERRSLLQIDALYNNFDAYVVRYAEEMLKARPEKRKLFIMISDGQPASDFSSGSTGVRQNAEAVAHMKEEGINVLAFGVGNVPQTLFEYMYGNAFINVSDISQLFDKLADALRVAINGEEY